MGSVSGVGGGAVFAVVVFVCFVVVQPHLATRNSVI